MRKSVLLVAFVLLAMFVATPAFAELELGLSWTPVPADADDPNATGEEELESMMGFHVGYGFWGIFYASWDSLVMPPRLIAGFTGYELPGFLNLYDAGIRLRIGPVIAYVTAGINNLYVYRQAELGQIDASVGANLRLGAGAQFGWWGVNVSGTAVFDTFKQLTQTVGALAGTDLERQVAVDTIVNGLIPSLNVTLYF
jgi:hypothetical protein